MNEDPTKQALSFFDTEEAALKAVQPQAITAPPIAAEANVPIVTAEAPIVVELDTYADDLTAEEIKFCSLVAKGYSQVQAYKQAFPAKSGIKAATARKNASILVSKSNIYREISSHVRTQARLARLAEGRIDEILTDGSIDSKTNKVADVAMFMYEQANGKAVMKIEQKSALVAVTYNLGGENAPPIPPEILAKLNQA